MRRAFGSLRMPWFGVLALCASFIVRGIAALGEAPQRYPDSVGYDTLKFFSPTDRPWPIPFLFSVAGSDDARIVLHVVLGTLAWGSLAWVLSQSVRWRRVVFVATLIVGLSPQIIRYDVAMLSESLSITFVVSAIASTLYRLRVRTPLSTSWWAISLTFCVLSRPTHLLIVGVCVVPVVWKLVATRRKSLTVGGMGFIALLMVGIFTVQQSQHMSLLNLYTVISSRVITDVERFEWFVDKGMPNIDGMRAATGYDYTEDLPPEVAQVVELPPGQQPPTLMRVGGVQLAQWLEDNGWKTMATYLITHPFDTLTHAQQLADPALTPPNGDFLPLQNGPMLPWFIFLSWQIWAMMIVVCCGVLSLRHSTRPTSRMLLTITATTFLVYLATVHTSGIEHVRHSSTVAAVVRILGLAAVVSVLPQRTISGKLDEDAETLS